MNQQIYFRLSLLLTLIFVLSACFNNNDKGKRRVTLQNDSIMMVADSTPFFIGKNLYLIIMDYPTPKPSFSIEQEIGFLEKRLIPGFQQIDSLRREGIPVFGGAMVLKPGCAFIIQARDNMHLQEMLRTNPLTEYSKVTVIPLLSFGESLFRYNDKDKALREKLNK